MTDKPVDYTLLGAAIRKKRFQKQWTQEKVAEMVNISTPFLSRIEKGDVILSVATLVKIAKVLDLSLDDILLHKSIDKIKLNSEQKEHLINFLKFLADSIDTIG